MLPFDILSNIALIFYNLRAYFMYLKICKKLENSFKKMSEIEDLEDVFRMVKPVCCRIAQSADVADLQEFASMLQRISRQCRQELEDYLMYPLRLSLKRCPSLNSEQQIDIFNCIKLILDGSQCRNWASFADTFPKIFILLSSNENPTEPATEPMADLSETFLLSLLSCGGQLVSSLPVENLEKIFSKEFIPVLGHAICITLKLIQISKSNQVKLAGIELIKAISFYGRNECSKIEIEIVSNCFAAFLPGISMSFSGLITSDATLNHEIFVAGFECWAHVLCLVFGNESASNERNVESKESDSVDPGPGHVLRTKNWLKTTSEKLHSLLSTTLNKTGIHSHWKVQLGIAKFCGKLLEKCSKSMPNSTPMLLEMILVLSVNDYHQVSTAADAFLEDFKQKNGEVAFFEELEELLYKVCEKLPQSVRMDNQFQFDQQIKLMTACLRRLGQNGLDRFCLSRVDLRKFFLAIGQILEFDRGRISIISECNVSSFVDGLCTKAVRPQLAFKYLTNEKFLIRIFDIFHLIWKFGDKKILVNSFLDFLAEFANYSAQFYFVMNSMLASTEAQLDEDLTMIICETAKDHLECLNFDEIQIKDSDVAAERFAPTKETLLARAILECLSDCLLVSPVESVQTVLPGLLYPVLFCASSDHPFVADSAWRTLHDFAVAARCGNISTLLQSNLDSILNAVSIRLRHYSVSPRSPLVLIAVVSQLSVDSIPKLKPVVGDLLQSLDENYAERSVQFVKVLLVTLKAISIWFPDSMPAPKHADVAEPMPDLESESDAIMEPIEDEKPDLPPHVKLTVDILHRSKHLLFSHSVPLRLAVLDTVNYGFAILRHWEDELLPMIHQCWPGIATRINDSNPYVALKAFESACWLAENSKSFMYRRITDDVLPTVCRMLKSYANESAKTGSIYEQTGTFKFQLVCLKRLAGMCNNVKVLERDLSGVREALDLYRTADQPDSLKIAATKCLESFQPYNVE